jgi:DNA (cytosine-5)-methyltransferase 1
LTDQYERVRLTQIQRKCHIRFVPKEDVLAKRIPFPYNRGGSGDFWFFSMGLIAKDGPPDLKFLARPPKHFKEGEDFASGPILGHLAGLSLFGGGGNFDRGIEEGGAVEIRSVIEWDAAAIHTQRVNAHDVNGKRLWCGSVDDHLKATLEGKHHELIARIGDVDIILAGSPCPGRYKWRLSAL